MALRGCFQTKSSKKRAKKGSVGRPFSPKAGSMRRPQCLKGPQILAARSTSSSNRTPVSASIRSISSVASATGRVEVSITSSHSGRRLVVVADAGERLQRAGARLGVVALGVAALADLGRRRDMDLAERGVGDAARRGAVIAPTARPRRRWRCGRCAPDGSRLRRAGGCFRCGPAARSRDRR